MFGCSVGCFCTCDSIIKGFGLAWFWESSFNHYRVLKPHLTPIMVPPSDVSLDTQFCATKLECTKCCESISIIFQLEQCCAKRE